jgi:hypothetical protein
MALTKQQQFERCLTAAKLVKVWMDAQVAAGLDSKAEINFTTGIFAEVIHRLPKITSGYISEKALTSKGSTTKDHYFGRKVSGDLIYENIMKGASINRLALIMMSRSRCHEVTSAENTLLKKFDTKKKFKSKLDVINEYKQAGIILIYLPRGAGRKSSKTVYIIDGIEYTGKEAMKKFDITQSTLWARCNSKAKKGKYTSWTIKKNP